MAPLASYSLILKIFFYSEAEKQAGHRCYTQIMHFLYVYWFIALTFHLKYVLFSLHLSIFPNSFFFTNMKHCTKYWTFNVAEPEPNFVLAPAPTFWLKKSCLHAGAGWRSRIRLQEMKNPGTDQLRNTAKKASLNCYLNLKKGIEKFDILYHYFYSLRHPVKCWHPKYYTEHVEDDV